MDNNNMKKEDIPHTKNTVDSQIQVGKKIHLLYQKKTNTIINENIVKHPLSC
jgi:hypothetical protein